MHCKGCFNKESWDKDAGKEFNAQTMYQILNALNNEYVEGLSILGGDPFESYNIDTVRDICAEVKKYYPDKTIWVWTGRKYENFKDHSVMQFIDVLVDGAYIESKRIINEGNRQEYRGSSNQRVIQIRSVDEKTL